MSADERVDVDRLRARLARLDDDDVSGHPAVLDDVHRSLVAALDELARPGSARAGG